MSSSPFPKVNFNDASLTKKGALRGHPAGMKYKTATLIERLVRFDTNGAVSGLPLSDQEIAKVLGCSTRRIMSLRKRVQYAAKKIELTTGIPASFDENVELSKEARKQQLREMLPAALRVYEDILFSKPVDTASRRMQLEVAKQVLDREGSLPIISRTDIHATAKVDHTHTAQVSKELLEALEGASVQKPTSDPLVKEAVTINQSFANPESLSIEAQEEAMYQIENWEKLGVSVQ